MQDNNTTEHEALEEEARKTKNLGGKAIGLHASNEDEISYRGIGEWKTSAIIKEKQCSGWLFCMFVVGVYMYGNENMGLLSNCLQEYML